MKDRDLNIKLPSYSKKRQRASVTQKYSCWIIKCHFASGIDLKINMKGKSFCKISRKSCTFCDGGVELDIFNIVDWVSGHCSMILKLALSSKKKCLIYTNSFLGYFSFYSRAHAPSTSSLWLPLVTCSFSWTTSLFF